MKRKATTQLQAGRPPLAKSVRTMSRKASRTLINTHHQLEKRRQQAAKKGDKIEEALIEKEISKIGGIGNYQRASLQGQSLDRGGDTSKILLDWLPTSELGGARRKLRMLEVGSLSTRNACSLSGLFDMVHIDLNSQEPGIEPQDFMKRPLPEDDSQKFDIISLSLVINFVPDAATRGQMLERTLSFLRATPSEDQAAVEDFFPSVFLVLPRSCVDNSRYFTEARLEALMGTLGFAKISGKTTQKLAYSLWKMGATPSNNAKFPKKEINPGKTRNNFVITLDRSTS
ncbi:putative methyltransferase-domain-containing protein [Emericellopsis atlantica]|uniref:25S rRNA adenine-N(1) methyltransferase n=1 Tax=Emericellopsis atlantica TaxID=2614577 RepID=A0A9P7ZJC0_9HYPO|nr:putative methyltransferase-domain-containing protein [Emericellopsis atlantica]KAG9252771.1 putative methyltransferase-domain-containing protein [Emericellopsis atlantica]